MRDEPNARTIVAALRGKWHGGRGTCFCPAHNNTRTPAMSVTAKPDGVVLVHCFAGCDNRDVIRALRDLGLWPDREERAHPSYHGTVDMPLKPEQPDEQELRRMRRARAIWDASSSIAGSLGEVYMRSRAITRLLPGTLRFNPSVQHTVQTTCHPCVIAAIQDALGDVTAVQRIYLRADGTGKADLAPAKAGLGPMRDGAVRLGRIAPLMGIAEGVETALSASQMFSLPVWACLGAGRLKSVALPEECTQVVIFADNGDVGLQRAQEAVATYRRQGREAFIEAPPDGAGDWNDVLRSARRAA